MHIYLLITVLNGLIVLLIHLLFKKELEQEERSLAKARERF